MVFTISRFWKTEPLTTPPHIMYVLWSIFQLKKGKKKRTYYSFEY